MQTTNENLERGKLLKGRTVCTVLVEEEATTTEASEAQCAA